MPTQPTGTPGPDSRTPTVPGVEVDTAQQSLASALRFSFNILRVLMVVLLVLYVVSGVFTVNPGEQGLVARLGRLRQSPTGDYVFEPGTYWWMLPDPFDQKITISGQVQTQTLTTFMFRHEKAATAANLADILGRRSQLEPGRDGAMFTGDKNLSHGRWTVQYRIDDGAAFVENVGEKPADFARMLERLTETAVVREVAGRTVEEVTREALDSVRGGVHRRLQEALNRLRTGVTVVQVVANTIEPATVRQAFLDVVKAQAERQTTENKARQKESETLNTAAGDQYEALLRAIRAYGAAQMRDAGEETYAALLAEIDARLEEAETKDAGQVAVKLREARAEANAINERLRREYEEFEKYLEARAAQPRITLLGLWAQMRAEILGNPDVEINYMPERADEIEILINRDQERLRKLEEERTLKRQKGQPNP